jgi:hypothetical protein
MKYFLILMSFLIIHGCNNKNGLERLRGIWIVDVDSTMLESRTQKFPILGWEEYDTPDNFSRIRYEIKGDQLISYECYNCERDPGQTNKITVYDEDKTSVTVLMHPQKKGYSSDHPEIKELIRRDPMAAILGIYGLKVFELTKENEAKLYSLAIDAKGNLFRNFSGIHLIRTRGPIPERKPQLPKWISLENQNHALNLSLSIPAINDERNYYLFTIDNGFESQGYPANWKVYTKRFKKGLKIFVKCKWDSGLCDTWFVVPYEKDDRGHKNGVTYTAIWMDKEKAKKENEMQMNKPCP